MIAPLVFLDCETTGLALTDDIWEFAAIRREPDGFEFEHHLFVEHDRAKCAALPYSFRTDHERRYDPSLAVTAEQAAHAISVVFDGAPAPHVVGAVPNFDTERLALLMGRYGLMPSWHYHLIDVENLAVGWINGVAARAIDEARMRDETPPPVDRAKAAPPWDSDAISRACGVEPPGDGVRHTAMGDVRWAMSLYDAITGAS